MVGSSNIQKYVTINQSLYVYQEVRIYKSIKNLYYFFCFKDFQLHDEKEDNLSSINIVNCDQTIFDKEQYIFRKYLVTCRVNISINRKLLVNFLWRIYFLKKFLCFYVRIYKHRSNNNMFKILFIVKAH